METKLNVRLINHTPNPQKAIATAARLCYSKVGASDLIENMTEEQIERILNIILSNGHSSTLEHASYTFAIEGVSRALTHQLVRHRLASFSQQSQRYVKANEEISLIKPESIKCNSETNKVFDEAIKTIESAYTKLFDAGIPAEDARYVLPNAAETKIVVTMNVRELLHFFTVRCCNRAQWEIRELAWKMLELVRPTAPLIFLDAGPDCIRDKCHEGNMTCKKPYKKISR